MLLKDTIQFALKNLRNRELRSWLTIIGIIIGIVTIITVLSIGEGLKRSITAELETFGSDRMFVIPVNIEKSGFSPSAMGSKPTGKLFEKDAERVWKAPGVKTVSKMIYGRASIEFKGKAITSLVYASTADLFEQWSNIYIIEEGRYLKDSEQNVVVLGNDAANQLFGKDKIGVGNIMHINEKDYRVIGILKKIGTSLSQSDDAAIYVPFEDGKELFKNQLSKDEISFISIQLEEGFDAEQVKEKIEAEIAASHRVSLDDKDFTVVTADFINKTVGAVLDVVTAFLFAITVISAVVGGIGIANTMFASVIERTKDIGIMKAVGASRNDIMQVFILESGIIGLVGGFIGIVVGLIILLIAGSFGIPVLIKVELIAFALVFSIGVGVVSGVFPARQAAGMDTVEALRFE